MKKSNIVCKLIKVVQHIFFELEWTISFVLAYRNEVSFCPGDPEHIQQSFGQFNQFTALSLPLQHRGGGLHPPMSTSSLWTRVHQGWTTMCTALWWHLHDCSDIDHYNLKATWSQREQYSSSHHKGNSSSINFCHTINNNWSKTNT